MRTVYLCGHTGSENRGCEALVRSTAELLTKCDQTEICAMTMDIAYDTKVQLNACVNLLPYPHKPLYIRGISCLRRKLLNDGIWSGRYMYRELFSKVKKGDILFNIGGDTYCYGVPNMSYALNEKAEEKGIPTVFWGCSVDERVLRDRQMQNDINRYAVVAARETKSYQLLRQVIRAPEKLYLMSDPAFSMKAVPVQLPDGFLPHNTTGINLSPLVMGCLDDPDNMVLKNVYFLIDRILGETEMHVCLIPHVYDPVRNTEDIRVLRKVYEKYRNNSRVSIIQEDLSCVQLKYIVSQCRFFVGARTHPTIAAYSSAVPALAISYSIKSLGIAQDVLGDAKRYAVAWKSLAREDQLWEQFSSEIMNREQEILERYQKMLPEYIVSSEIMLRKLLNQI